MPSNAPPVGSHVPSAFPPASNPPPFSPAFPASAQQPAATADADEAAPPRNKRLLILAAVGAGLLALVLLAGAATVAVLAIRDSAPVANRQGGSSATASPAMPPPLPSTWQTAEVLGASASFPTGAIQRSKTDSAASQRVLSAESSAIYELTVIVNQPPGEDPSSAVAAAASQTIHCSDQWVPVQHHGRDGFRAETVLSETAQRVCVTEAYPLATGWVLISYQAFSLQPEASRPSREVREDEATIDHALGFMDSLQLPASLPVNTDGMDTSDPFRKLGEAEKKRLYGMYKIAYRQTQGKIKIPRGEARLRLEAMLDEVLDNEIKKLSALFDVSEAEVRGVVAEGQALGW